MIVECKTSARLASPPWRKLLPYDDQDFYPIESGAHYSVVAMQAVCDGVEYLVHTEVDEPIFIPADQFFVVDPRLPDWWVYRFIGYPKTNSYWIPIARWGYSEMVMNDLHHGAVTDKDPTARGIYFKNLELCRDFDRGLL